MKRIPTGLALMLLLGACQLPSVHPLYEDPEEDTVFLPELLGVWLAEEEGGREGEEPERLYFVFEREWGNTYLLNAHAGPEHGASFEAHVVKIEDRHYLNTFPVGGLPEELLILALHLIPAHLIWSLELEGDELRLAYLGTPELIRYLKENPEVVPWQAVGHSDDEGDPFLTATSDELQRFLGGNEGRRKLLFGENPADFRRVQAVEFPNNEH